MTERPGYAPDRVLRGLSLPRRVGYVLAGLSGSLGVAMVGVLWATEPATLPVRTQLAFAGLITAGLTWGGLSAWALARRPLFAVDRLVAAGLAVIFSGVSLVGMVAVAQVRASTTGTLVGAGVGLILVAIASTLLVRSYAYRAALLARERELGPPITVETEPGRRLPIGPLALALRHHGSGSGGRRVVILALILGVILVGGIVVLLH